MGQNKINQNQWVFEGVTFWTPTVLILDQRWWFHLKSCKVWIRFKMLWDSILFSLIFWEQCIKNVLHLNPITIFFNFLLCTNLSTCVIFFCIGEGWQIWTRTEFIQGVLESLWSWTRYCWNCQIHWRFSRFCSTSGLVSSHQVCYW